MSGRIDSSESFQTQLQTLARGWSSHLLVVLPLLQHLQAAVVRLTPHGHVGLLLQDVQAELVAAAQTLLHVQRQASMLLRHSHHQHSHAVIKYIDAHWK